MGEEVVVGEGGQRRLDGVALLGVRLLQRDGRDGHLALGDVAQVGVQGHAACDLGDQQVGVEGIEGGAHVGFLAQRHEAGQQLADAAVVDVAVLVAGHVVGGVVGVDAGHVLEVLLLLQVQQVVDGGDDAVGVVLLVTLGDLDQVAVQLLGMLGEVLDEVHVAGHAGLHIQSAAAEHVVAGLNVRPVPPAPGRRSPSASGAARRS